MAFAVYVCIVYNLKTGQRSTQEACRTGVTTDYAPCQIKCPMVARLFMYAVKVGEPWNHSAFILLSAFVSVCPFLV